MTFISAEGSIDEHEDTASEPNRTPSNRNFLIKTNKFEILLIGGKT
jgi:hypothetical protein